MHLETGSGRNRNDKYTEVFNIDTSRWVRVYHRQTVIFTFIPLGPVAPLSPSKPAFPCKEAQRTSHRLYFYKITIHDAQHGGVH